MPLVMCTNTILIYGSEDNKGTTFFMSVVASSLMGSHLCYDHVVCLHRQPMIPYLHQTQTQEKRLSLTETPPPEKHDVRSSSCVHVIQELTLITGCHIDCTFDPELMLIVYPYL